MFHDSSVKVLSCPLLPEQAEEAVKHPVADPVDVLVAGILRDDYVEVLEMLRIDTAGGR